MSGTDTVGVPWEVAVTRSAVTALHLIVLLMATLTAASSAPKPASQINLFEAETLLFLSPEIQGVIHRGMEVALDPDDDNPRAKEPTFFFFRVRARVDAPSNLVGYYAVNRYTADVLSIATEEFISGPELAAVQTVIRKVHGIDSAVLQMHRTKDWETSKVKP